MKKPGDRLINSYVPYFETKDGYRWLIFEKESGYHVVGRDGREQYATKEEAVYNMPSLHGYYVDKVYYG